MDESEFGVLLLQAAQSGVHRKNRDNVNTYPPLGLLYIATMVAARGYPVRCADYNVGRFDAAEFCSLVSSFAPRVVGISCTAASYAHAVSLGRLCLDLNPEIRLVYGGPFATFCYDQLFDETGAGCVVSGEGEQTFLELVQAYREAPRSDTPSCLSAIRGLAYRSGQNGTIVTQPRERCRELDRLPFPDRSLLPLEGYSVPFSLSTTRGCPGACSFCSSRAFWGRKISFRSAESIIEEIVWLGEKHDLEYFYFVDDTFTFHVPRMRRVCELLIDAGLQLLWGCLSRTDVLDEELAQLLYRAGCRKAKFGVESGDQAILDHVGKRVSLAGIEKTVRICYGTGLLPICSLILGHPWDTMETMRKTIEFAGRLQSDYGAQVQIGLNTPFPGTYQWDHAEELGIRIESRNWEDYILTRPVISTRNFSKDELQNLWYEALEQLHFADPNDAKPRSPTVSDSRPRV